ncbi:MAG: MBL fold metallo-hydrolase [Clostridia bacterium]|nr:MBL fold metallo-hydrolase [Clostridia bacterium]
MIVERIVVGKYAVNSYFIMDEETKEAAIVDPGAQAHLIQRVIDEYNAKVKYVLLTHGHGDHIGAVETIRDENQAKVVAAEEEQDMLLDPKKNESLATIDREVAFDADWYVRDQENIKLGQLNLKAIKTPGHTKGGICYLLDKYLFSGDTLFRRSVGRADLYGGDFGQLINSITSKLYVLNEDVRVFPGHGPHTTIGEEKKENPFT